MSNYTTYNKARCFAEQITLDELADLLEHDDNPYVFPAPKKRRQIAMNARLRVSVLDSGEKRGWVGYERCTFGTGVTTDDGVSVGWRFDRPIFVFGEGDAQRVVQVERPA